MIRMMMASRLSIKSFSFLICIAVSACSFSHGVKHEVAGLNATIAPNCIAKAIDSVPGLKSEIVPTKLKCKKPMTAEIAKYHVEDAEIWVGACYAGTTLKEFTQSYSKVGPAKQEDLSKVEKIRKVMTAVEESVAKRCRVPDLPAAVKEKCTLVKCT